MEGEAATSGAACIGPNHNPAELFGKPKRFFQIPLSAFWYFRSKSRVFGALTWPQDEGIAEGRTRRGATTVMLWTKYLPIPTTGKNRNSDTDSPLAAPASQKSPNFRSMLRKLREAQNAARGHSKVIFFCPQFFWAKSMYLRSQFTGVPCQGMPAPVWPPSRRGSSFRSICRVFGAFPISRQEVYQEVS